MTLEIPMSLPSVSNLREHWATRAKRVKKQRGAIALLWKTSTPRWGPMKLPAVVTLTRISPRQLDSHDNLRAAFKAVADELAAQLGVDDRDPRVTWKYEQAKGPAAVRIEVEAA